MTNLGRQKSIYLNAFSGKKPLIPFTFPELERAANKKMHPQSYGYIAGGAGSGGTMKANRRAIEEVQLVPRMLKGVAQRDLSVTIFGRSWSTPFFLCPIGVLELAGRGGDSMAARAAASLDVPVAISNQSSEPMEQIAAAAQPVPPIFQLYWSKSDELVQSFLSRAEAIGCSAIMVTVDTTLLGWRPIDLSTGYLPFLLGKGIAQYTSDPVFNRLSEKTSTASDAKPTLASLKNLWKASSRLEGSTWQNFTSRHTLKVIRTFIDIYSRPTISWKDLSTLKEFTHLPLIVKGILHPEDAQKAIDHGVDGIVVSNHGGRQVDGAVGAMDLLPAVVEQLGNKVPVFFDSGIRSGTDALKALALGATAVGIGRPYVYGLALAGEQGVRELLMNFIEDLDLTMGLCGCQSVAETQNGHALILEDLK